MRNIHSHPISARASLVGLALACAVVLAVAPVAAGGSGAGLTASAASAKCKPGPQKINGTWWIVYCGPAAATARFSGRTVRFTSGSCKTRGQLRVLNIGRRVFRGVSPKTKYWEHVSGVKGDGTFRKNVFVEWWLGTTHYLMVDLKVTYGAKQSRGTFTGNLQSKVGRFGTFRNRGKASGSFHC